MMNSKRVIYIILMALYSASAQSDILSVHCPVGCPENPTDNDLIFGHLYTLSNNPTTKFADWVAYEVDVINFGPGPARKWIQEPLLDKTETLEDADYKNANRSVLKSDRGHQAPLASFAGSRYWSELNHLSNITPQHEDLNRGAWRFLEAAVRDAVGYKRSLYVITGTLYTDDMPSLPHADEPHTVPSGYFKIIYDIKGNAQAFSMKQTTPRRVNYCDKTATIASIQNQINYQLPGGLSDSATLLARLDC